MKRREFITLLGGAAAVGWPLAARAQTPVPVIGFLGANTPTTQGPWTAAFVQRLRELSWVEGRTVSVEYRWAEGSRERAMDLAAEFVRLKVDVIVTSGTANVLAAKQATSAIPIVFAAAADPVGTGVVVSLARPGGNITGLSVQQPDLAGKRLEILREAVPSLQRLAIIGNAGAAGSVVDMDETEDAARRVGFDVVRLEFRRSEDIVPLFDKLDGRGAHALYVASDPLVTTNRLRINILALGARLPTMHAVREHADDGGLISYGPNFPDLFRRAGDLVDKVLRGVKPADIPVAQPIKFDLVINLITAKALRIAIPASLLVRADEVIE